MSLLLFIYNILLMLLYAVNLSCFAILYFVSKQKVYGLYCIVFCLFLFEHTTLYLYEAINSFNSVAIYDSIMNLIFFSLFFIGRKITTNLFDDSIKTIEWVSFFIYFLSFYYVTLYLNISLPNIIKYNYTLPCFIYLNVRSIYLTIKSRYTNVSNRLYVANSLRFYIFYFLFGFLIALEDYFRSYTDFSLTPNIFLSHRENLFLDIAMIIVSIRALKYIFVALEKILNSDIKRTSEETEVLFKKNIQKFCKEYKFTMREKNVFEEILKGSTSNEISKALYLSNTKVAATLRNIYVKTNVSTREDLKQLYDDYFQIRKDTG